MRQVRSWAMMFSLLVLFSAGSAFAKTVKIQFLGAPATGPHKNSPFFFSINNSPTPTLLISDDFSQQLSPGQTWNATVTPLLSDLGEFKGEANSLQRYEAAGLIFLGVLHGTYSAVAGNWAIWALFSPSAMSNTSWLKSGAQSIYNFYTANSFAALNSLTSNQWAELSTLVVYTPTPGSGGREFIGQPAATPEPGSLVLFGAGLVVAGRALRKKLLL